MMNPTKNTTVKKITTQASTNNAIAIGIQNGARTQIQGQVIVPVSFSVTKMIPRMEVTVIFCIMIFSRN